MKTSSVFLPSAVRHMIMAACVVPFITLPVGAISVTPTTSATDLVNVIRGPAITIVGTPTLTGGPVSAGTFTGGLTTGIGINSGIVLTSGNATLIGNSNTSDSATGDFNGPGDAYLTTLSGHATYDATVLAFTFQTTSGNLFFNFVFGSEEYNEYTNSTYNDVFAFTVDGVNIALIPGTSTPVAINTVNGGNPLGVDASHPDLYNNNDPSDGGTHPFEYDGFTNVFTVSATGLASGVDHSMRLAIADASDHAYDSGVFIQAGSFDEDPHPHDAADAGSTAALLALGLSTLMAFARRHFRIA